MSIEPAITCRGLSKIYKVGFWQRKVRGLANLDINVQGGEVFGFVGPNGAGKTTTLKILVGLQFQSGGVASIFGHPVGTRAANELLGFLPERPYFYSHLTAKELLRFYGQLFNQRGVDLEKRVEALLERVGLLSFQKVPLRAYSKGMLQRAGLAQALLNNPKVILLDEPMSGLDPMGRMLVRDLILEEKAKGTTVFFSSHILADVEQICDRVGIMVQGELRACGPIQELLSTDIEHIDCVVKGLSLAQLKALDTSLEILGQDGNSARLRILPNQIDAFVDQIRAQGGQLQELTPKRQSLENLLLEQLGVKTNEADPKNMGVFG
jgi:ABC-2 type transport system ATP-binding protein